MKKVLQVLTVSILLYGCSESGKHNRACIPNYEENGLGLLVSKNPNHPTTFNFQVCYSQANVNNTVSIYGVIDENDMGIINPNVRWRYKNLDLDNESSFSVEFENDDNYFAIFKDAANGDLQVTDKIIHGELYQ